MLKLPLRNLNINPNVNKQHPTSLTGCVQVVQTSRLSVQPMADKQLFVIPEFVVFGRAGRWICLSKINQALTFIWFSG